MLLHTEKRALEALGSLPEQVFSTALTIDIQGSLVISVKTGNPLIVLRGRAQKSHRGISAVAKTHRPKAFEGRGNDAHPTDGCGDRRREGDSDHHHHSLLGAARTVKQPRRRETLGRPCGAPPWGLFFDPTSGSRVMLVKEKPAQGSRRSWLTQQPRTR